MSILGRPIIVLPYERPGCWARVLAFIGLWARRLVWLVAGFLLGVVLE